jgi:hypothetical protein
MISFQRGRPLSNRRWNAFGMTPIQPRLIGVDDFVDPISEELLLWRMPKQMGFPAITGKQSLPLII